VEKERLTLGWRRCGQARIAALDWARWKCCIKALLVESKGSELWLQKQLFLQP